MNAERRRLDGRTVTMEPLSGMRAGKPRIPSWLWLLIAPVALVVLVMVAAIARFGVRNYLAKAQQAEALLATGAPAPAATPPAQLTGSAVDLSTVMGRARKLADAWQGEAALLGIEATLHRSKIQTHDGASAKLTFGPSPFAASPGRSGIFVVVYDKAGLRGAPAPGPANPGLPEPMCAPERVLLRAMDLGDGPLWLRYALDASQRPMWLVSPQESPERERLFDPQDCRQRGIVAGRNKR